MAWKWGRMNTLYLQFPSWLSYWWEKNRKNRDKLLSYITQVIKPFLSNHIFLIVEEHVISAECIIPGFHISLLSQISLYIFASYLCLHYWAFLYMVGILFVTPTGLGEGHQVKGFIKKIGGSSGNYQVTNQGRSRGRAHKLRRWHLCSSSFHSIGFLSVILGFKRKKENYTI